MISSVELETKFCFFIDGLDEYGGPEVEIASLIRKLSSGSGIKLCLSSRPRTVFERVFTCHGPHNIALHDHTEGDTERLVRARFDAVGAATFVAPSDLASLTQSAVQKSSGVFLWVVLVVRELSYGFRPPCTIEDLRKQLSELPETLDA